MSFERTKLIQLILFCLSQSGSKNLLKYVVGNDDSHMKNQESSDNDDTIICSDENKIANMVKMSNQIHLIYLMDFVP